MEYTSLVDTSLDLNIAKPLRVFDDQPKQDVHSNFFHFGSKMPRKEEASDLLEELKRVSAENQKLTEMLTVVCENYNALRNQLMEFISKNGGGEMDNSSGSRKRKAESAATTTTNNNGNMDGGAAAACESSSSDEDSCKKPRAEHVKTQISRVCVRTEASDTSLIVKDGYQWRKYGQKVTRDNPSPRAYFKCSFAPSCPVKKKVQRSAEDQSVLVATYEGEHNHPHPSKLEAAAAATSSAAARCVTTLGSVPCSTTRSSSGATITLDLTKPKPNDHLEVMKNPNPSRINNSPELQQFLVEQMASSLTKDPSFRAAIAAAISGRILQPNNQKEQW